MHVYFKLSNWRKLPSLVRAYIYLFQAGWNIFIRRQSAQLWSQRWGQDDLDIVDSDADWLKAEKLSTLIAVAARVPFPWARCLQRSLALSMWMDANGMISVLRIGVRKSRSGIEAHSWVEFHGKILNDSEFVGTTFTAFELPGKQQYRRMPSPKRD